jgi:hypothetical protein
MFRKNDPYTFKRLCNLVVGSTLVGTVAYEYQVTAYDDLLMADAASVVKPKTRQYIVNVTQRIIITNKAGMTVSPVAASAYVDYPVLINTYLQIDKPPAGVAMQLLDYSPQTVNTVVQSSGSSGISSGQGQSSSVTNTVGSTTSQTNSFGVSVTVSETPSATANYEHSETQTSERSRANTSDSSTNSSADASSSAAMSVKDWGGYAFLNPETTAVTWIFGQEFPWSATECRLTDNTQGGPDASQVRVIIPSTMSSRLWDGVSLYPPSQLSMFGINFVMKGQWLVTVDNGTPSSITVDSSIALFTASHTAIPAPTTGDPTTLIGAAFMDPKPALLDVGNDLSATLDLAIMSLHPLGFQGQPGIVGFIPDKFTVLPASGANKGPISFEIFAASNTLLVKDTSAYPSSSDEAGFTATDTSLNAAFTANCTTLQITAFFKVTDVVSDYMLHMKHWKAGNAPLTLTFVFNDDPSSAMTKSVDDLEAEGGENNLLSIALRNQDYASIDYHDFLQLGLNSVQISIELVGTDYADNGYQIRALSIEKA